MSDITLQTKIVLRCDTAAQWALENPLLLPGEPGVETDTGRLKLGDGSALWNDLPYAQGSAALLGDGAPGEAAETGTLWVDAAAGAVYLNCSGEAEGWQRLVLAQELGGFGAGDMQQSQFAKGAKAKDGYVDKAVVADALVSPLTTAEIAEAQRLYFTPERAGAVFEERFAQKSVRSLVDGGQVLTAGESLVLDGGSAHM